MLSQSALPSSSATAVVDVATGATIAAMLSLRPRPLARWWRLKARALAHLRTAPDRLATTTTLNLRQARAATVAVWPHGAREPWHPPVIRSSRVMQSLSPSLLSLSLSPAVIGHGNPIIAKRRNSLNSQSLVYDGDRQAQTRIFRIFSKIRQMAVPSSWLTRQDIILESQVRYPPHQPEKIQRSFDRNL